MPTYQYELVEGECKKCGGAFEIRQTLSEPALKHCPVCQKAVRKCIPLVNTPKVNKSLSVIDAKKSGFQVLKRRDKGVYEKL